MQKVCPHKVCCKGNKFRFLAGFLFNRVRLQVHFSYFLSYFHGFFVFSPSTFSRYMIDTKTFFVQKVNVIDEMTLNVDARAKIAHACIDLSREEGVFGI